MMTNLLNGAHVANKLFSTIASLRLLLVMFLTLTVSANAWGATYTKVTSAPADWSGEYIVVYENNNTAHVWTGVDAANCYTTAAISSNSVTGDFVTITIAPMTNGYSIKVNGGTNSGKYIYGTSGSNKLNFGANAQLNTLSYETDWVKITSNTSVLTFNKASSDMRFRYYKSSSYSSQQHIQLYKLSTGGGSTTVDPEVTFSNGEYTIGGAALDLSTLWDSNSTGAVTYSVTNAGTTGATVNGTSFTATAAGTCTVQASQAATATHNAATATASITVTAPAGGGEGECSWTLVTDASTLKAGDRIVIAAKDYDCALGMNSSNGEYRQSVAITKDGSKITIDNNVQIINLYAGSQENTLLFNVGTNSYLYAASSSNNHLKTKTTTDTNCDWNISITQTGIATITAKGDKTRNIIRYNATSGQERFSCYSSSTTNMKDVSIYKCVECNTETSR